MKTQAGISEQPLSDSYGKQQCRRYTQFIQKYPNKINKDLGTANGLTLYYLSDGLDRVLALYDQTKVVAYAKLEDSPFDMTRKCLYNLYVAKDFRGKSLATVLHLGALHVYKKLMSDTTMALGALKAFKSMERYGYRLKMLDTKSGKTVPFKWGSDGIPVVDGESIEDAEHYALYI